LYSVSDVNCSQSGFDYLEEIIELSLFCNSLWERIFFQVIHGSIPLMKQEEHSDLFRSIRLQDILDGSEILLGFGHLQSVDVQMTGVPEVVDPTVTSIICFGLSNFIIVMREFQINST